ncbi:hypothetical protein, conserved [Trypanosoma brucei gambiense DAL972]|uniref:Pentacotripeptide-repeat region of PRORP domain-containing protein n=1 Tax=Trypanosoma brucei gambiense (strain MHOM/CI/86/DAL972) TaxID=679716 RepID=C9ZZT8_TRYB9|nr:hypothetical protein, conserved [Trypanosoma brucei gambiense DAL972]CBH16496.1 hypothetical protein, conserved [Trypanosoma brucei gambiense DAL972]|eukprot:XP_011778760.1 hypothetical protein, conserved [Trypanosoma brucei gambiense DAL972]
MTLTLLRRGKSFDVTATKAFLLSRKHRYFPAVFDQSLEPLSSSHKQPKNVTRDVASSIKETTRIAENKSSLNYGVPGERGRSTTGITSPLAYLYRVQHGHFESLVALMSAPCAPHPLRVLADLLDEAGRLKSQLAENPGEGGYVVQSCEDQNDALKVLDRVTRSLSDVLDVRAVLRRAIGMLKDATEAASALGDVFSERELQRELREVEMLAQRLRHWSATTEEQHNSLYTCGENNGNLLKWTLPDVVTVEIRRALLVVCGLTGAYALAVECLEEIIALSDLNSHIEKKLNRQVIREGGWERKAKGTSHQRVHKAVVEETTFALDNVVESVEGELRQHLIAVSAEDHIMAITSCAQTRKFDIAHSLFQRFMQHAECGTFVITADDVTAALVALARCSGNTADFAMTQELLVKSEAARVVPVSVDLYTALIEAAGRASENPRRLEVALALYRQLRDGGFDPTPDTYAALIACCASAQEPTMGFGFYHEARQQCGVGGLTPAVYTNLLLAYARAGYGSDARTTLEVLVEAGAPLTRSAFHAVLACAVTHRDAQEVLQLMQSKYNIAPTPQTYAYLIAAAGAESVGVSTVLSIFDWQEMAIKSLLERYPCVGNTVPQTLLEKCNTQRTALSTSEVAPELEKEVLSLYPAYGEALELALLQLRVDPRVDPRLEPYIRPLLRVAQRRMNSFTTMAPQAPTFVPKGAAIAVLAADVLANIEEYFLPFVSFYSAVVIPYSSLVALQRGGGRRVNAAAAATPVRLLSDPLYCECGGEKRQIQQARRAALLRFLQKYQDVIHLVSLAEELALSRDCDRYGIGVKRTFTRCAALALNLARKDIQNVTKIYAEQECQIVLVSTNFEKCGRFVVDVKKELLQRGDADQSPKKGTRDSLQGLKAGLRRVSYHNPRTSPDWRPPVVSVKSLVTDPALSMSRV